MSNHFADRYLPAEVAGKSFVVVKLWLTSTPDLPMLQLYSDFLSRLVPRAKLSFADIKGEDLTAQLTRQDTLHIVSANLLSDWPRDIPMLPLPELVDDFTVHPTALEPSHKLDAPAIGIILFGPESTGKSVLSRKLGSFFQAPVVKEYVRLWFDVFGNSCTQDQAALIATIVAAFQEALASLISTPWVADTDALASWMWYEWYFGALPSHVDFVSLTSHKVYLLMADDIPFEADHQRRYSDRREFDTAYVEQFLQRYKVTYRLVSGDGDERLHSAFNAINSLVALPMKS